MLGPMMDFSKARLLALLLPAGLLAGAYAFQYVGGLYPCEMCWWQRYPHFVAIPAALFGFFGRNVGVQRVMVAFAAFALLTSGVIGGFHAGVEYGWWQGLTSCTATIGGSGEDFLKSILNAPLNRCDAAPWKLANISLAGFNFILSTLGAIIILWSIWSRPKP
jgi:disulfide bond formation protein DsbB